MSFSLRIALCLIPLIGVVSPFPFAFLPFPKLPDLPGLPPNPFFPPVQDAPSPPEPFSLPVEDDPQAKPARTERMKTDPVYPTDFAGSWELASANTGISAMHVQLMPSGKVVMFDASVFGPSKIKLDGGRCRIDKRERRKGNNDCWAHAVEYDVDTAAVRPLMVKTNTWCSSGALGADGRLIQTGGFNEGGNVVRLYESCKDCDWVEKPNSLSGQRWYSSDHILPDGNVIIVGGRRKFSYEFIPAEGNSELKVYDLPFLKETTDDVENNLYPFLHLSTDGNLFVFANDRSILLDYKNNRIVRTFPVLPGGSRNYPASGSAVLLPIRLRGRENLIPSEVLICGGATPESASQADRGVFVDALDTCGRITITDPNSQWKIERMPSRRVMGDMLILPNAQVLIINGAKSGTSGWSFARNPNLSPVLYNPRNPRNQRFQTLNPSTIPRMYHSSGVVLPDGKVLIAGSNTNPKYNYTSLYPTELRAEKFSPPYLDPSLASHRPNILTELMPKALAYGGGFKIQISLSDQIVADTDLSVTMYAPPFTTHSYSQNQRMLVLRMNDVEQVAPGTYQISVVAPPSAVVAPPGYYLLFVVHFGVPSEGVWVHIN
ncbi:aldehyde oxidase GLOX1 [Amborella trichopoda]|uniref:Galactose oxidase-like Early set domain-containing protein n=1 Tax=Amborella trichopoda TaxID=13333 RepID=W1NS29_AMBTC|nr:aldehyde oxidase GLOX1 [Amborella trichopoda]ERM98687.1 hypothetical protein AMTR_s00109p00131490 [Amborella trichopoda]|eukprot:XP_006833409.3 aldehyde oxidase GLOX1 [Amborella trichopoda]